jgi:hypothetical protein
MNWLREVWQGLMGIEVHEISDEEIARLALKRVNAIRETNGEMPLTKLKRGKKSSNSYCSLARSLTGKKIVGAHVDSGSITLDIDGGFSEKRPYHTDATKEFVRRFDKGKYPDLEYKPPA